MLFHKLVCKPDNLRGELFTFLFQNTAVNRVSQAHKNYPGKTGGEYLKKFAKALESTTYSARVSVECTYADFPTDSGEAYKFVSEVY